jgi:predicted DNA-binding protein
MKKTSVYLDEANAKRLRALAEEEGRSQAEVLRDAIYLYGARVRPARDRNFAIAKLTEADVLPGAPRPVSEIPDEELLKGFGE